MMSVDSLNAWGASWAAFMWARLSETTVVLTGVGLLWLLLRRRASPQLGYCLFLLVLVKSVLPIALPVPSRLAGLGPTHAFHRAVDWILLERFQAMPEEHAESGHSAAPAGDGPTGGAAGLVSWSNSAGNTVQARGSPPSPSAIAMICWAVIVLALLVRFARAQWRTDQLVRRASPIDPADMRVDLTRMRKQAGVWQSVRLVASRELCSPAVWGPFRPRLIIPQQLVRECLPDRMRWILLHELAHIRRGDVLIAPAQKLLQIAYFFNPAVWLANRVIDQQREYACDDTALAGCSDVPRHVCGEGLLSVVEHASGLRAAVTATLGLLDRGTPFAKRLTRILDDDRKAQTGLSARAVAMLLTVALLVMPSMQAADDLADRDSAAGNMTASVTTLTEPGDSVVLPTKGLDLLFPAELVGRWEGTCEPIVTWCKQERLALDVEIRSDGNVVGTIGDATIENGHARRNAPLAVLLGNPRYRVFGNLDGLLVESERIERAAGTLLFDFEDGHLVGEFNSSGTHFGAGDAMWMKCVDMKLAREGG